MLDHNYNEFEFRSMKIDKKNIRKRCSSSTNYLHDSCWISPRSCLECCSHYNWSWFGRICLFWLFVSWIELYSGSEIDFVFRVNALDVAPEYASVILGYSNTFAALTGIIAPALTGVLVQQQV